MSITYTIKMIRANHENGFALFEKTISQIIQGLKNLSFIAGIQRSDNKKGRAIADEPIA